MKIYMPPRLQLITTPVSPFAEEAEEHTRKWVAGYRLMESGQLLASLAAMKPGALAAHCFPTAAEADMCILADWMSWLFVIDDQNDEGSLGRRPDDFEQALAAIHATAFGDGAPAGPDPLAKALENIWERIRSSMTPAWRRRFVRHVTDYFAANTWQAAHRALEQTPTLDTFAQMRRDAGAIWPSFDLIEWVEGGALPPSLYMSSTYQTLLTSAADVVCWTNDLLTIDKELAHEDVHNLVLVTQYARGGTLQDAIDEVVQLTDERILQYLEAEAALPGVLDRLRFSAGEQAHVLNCVAMLRAWMRGHVDWGMHTSRYGQSWGAPVNRVTPQEMAL